MTRCGEYDIDATVRFRVAGADFLVLIEAKLHRNPIKREIVQILHSKVVSVGAQKGVIVSTAPFQSGALDFALEHGIALVALTEGRFTYEVRTREPAPPLTREKASEICGLPKFVAHCYSPGEEPGSIQVTVVSGQPKYAAELLLGA